MFVFLGKASGFYPHFQRICDQVGRSPTNVVTSAGLSSCLVTAWKNGASPKLETILSLAGELGVPVASLIECNKKTDP